MSSCIVIVIIFCKLMGAFLNLNSLCVMLESGLIAQFCTGLSNGGIFIPE